MRNFFSLKDVFRNMRWRLLKNFSPFLREGGSRWLRALHTHGSHTEIRHYSAHICNWHAFVSVSLEEYTKIGFSWFGSQNISMSPCGGSRNYLAFSTCRGTADPELIPEVSAIRESRRPGLVRGVWLPTISCIILCDLERHAQFNCLHHHHHTHQPHAHTHTHHHHHFFPHTPHHTVLGAGFSLRGCYTG